jgi:hypothetical protein
MRVDARALVAPIARVADEGTVRGCARLEPAALVEIFGGIEGERWNALDVPQAPAIP